MKVIILGDNGLGKVISGASFEGLGEHMGGYVTYLEVRLSPNSAQPEHLTSELKEKGWRPVWGRYDYAYYWDETWNWQNEDEYWKRISELHDVLRRYNVHYSLRTYERGKEDFWVGGYP